VRVGISLLTLAPGELGGSETYARALTRQLAAHGTFEYTALVPAHAQDAAAGMSSMVVRERLGVRRGPLRLASMRITARADRSLGAALGQLDVLHYPLTVEIPGAHAPRVVTLHDLQHRDLPQHFSLPRRIFRRSGYDRAAARAAAVVVPSEFVRRSVVGQLGLDSARVHVIHHGVDHDLFAPGDEAREPFLFYPARAWPHKNHDGLLEAFVLLHAEMPELRLLLAGGGLDALGPLPANVERLGEVPAEKLAKLYRTAACLVFPSLYEGFGLPPLEAMACGCPVACSNAASLPEVCGEAAVYFDPRSPEAIANGVREALALADELRTLGPERAAAFTWQASARRHEDVYRAVAG
jgi:glycosyltransferase involved in cell wall biosynthesis